MRVFKSKLVLGIIVFLSLGLLLQLVVIYLQHRIDALTALQDIPINLNEGNTFEKKLKITSNYDYRIWIHFDQSTDDPALACKVGLKFDPNDCSEIQSILDISWEIEADGIAEDGNSLNSNWGNDDNGITREIGKFSGIKEAEYSFVLRVNKDASELNYLNPTIEITPYFLDIQPDVIDGILILVVSFLFLGLGALLLLISIIIRFMRVPGS